METYVEWTKEQLVARVLELTTQLKEETQRRRRVEAQLESTRQVLELSKQMAQLTRGSKTNKSGSVSMVLFPSEDRKSTPTLPDDTDQEELDESVEESVIDSGDVSNPSQETLARGAALAASAPQNSSDTQSVLPKSTVAPEEDKEMDEEFARELAKAHRQITEVAKLGDAEDDDDEAENAQDDEEYEDEQDDVVEESVTPSLFEELKKNEPSTSYRDSRSFRSVQSQPAEAIPIGQFPGMYRSIRWSVDLGVLSAADTWASAAQRIRKLRQSYVDLKNRHLVSKSTLDEIEASPASLSVANPLTQSQDSPWYKHWQNEQVAERIRLDIVRTYSGDRYFQQTSTRQLLERILLVWALENPNISYRQGMNELLAIILIVLREDYGKSERVTTNRSDGGKAEQVSAESDGQNTPVERIDMPDVAALPPLLGEEWMEHDAFRIFNALMRLVRGWFMPGDASAAHEAASSRRARMDSTLSPLYLKFHHIHHQLLKTYDQQMYDRLQEGEVTPQLYLLRWIRILFTREFSLSQVLYLWDALFSHARKHTQAIYALEREEEKYQAQKQAASAAGDGSAGEIVGQSIDRGVVAALYEQALEFVDYIALAMLLNVRPLLFGEDVNSLLTVLMKYPRQESVRPIVALAKRLDSQGPQCMPDVLRELFASGDKRDAPHARKSLNPQRRRPKGLQRGGLSLDFGVTMKSLGRMFTGTLPSGFTMSANNSGPGTEPTSTSAQHPDNVFVGWLVKKGAGLSALGRTSLKRRWFVLRHGHLSYYATPQDAKPLKSSHIDMRRRIIKIVDAEKFCFTIEPGPGCSERRSYMLFAPSSKDMIGWVNVLEQAGQGGDNPNSNK